MWKYTGIKECNEYLLSLFLFDCKDEKKYIKTLYTLSNSTINEYRMFKIKKRNGKLRTIYEPSPLLKEIQRNILKNVLEERVVSKYAKAYRKGVSLKDNASLHVDKKIILKLDIRNFFDSISFMDVYEACFNIDYYPKSVGMLLAYLCTYQDHLVQGAPTSAYISNLVMKSFDEEIGMYCLDRNISYTRYSDDMTFSGDFNPKDIISFVRKKLYQLGLELNDKKTSVIYYYQNQNVTGITVNKKVQVNTKYRKKVRQEMYYFKKYGVGDKASLKGRVQYVLQINPYDKEFLTYKECL